MHPLLAYFSSSISASMHAACNSMNGQHSNTERRVQDAVANAAPSGELQLSTLHDLRTGQDCDFHQSLELYRFVSAMALLACGSIYFLGGILCFGLIKRSAHFHLAAGGTANHMQGIQVQP